MIVMHSGAEGRGMRLRDRPTGTGSESPRETSEHLSETLTLLEAAALTNTDPDALWERIRSTGIPFTLVSGRRDRGASVLVNTGDLVGAGLLPGRQAPRLLSTVPSPRVAPPHPSLKGSRTKDRSTVWWAEHRRVFVRAAMVLIVMALLPSVRGIPISGMLERVGLLEPSDGSPIGASHSAKARDKTMSRSHAPQGSTATLPRSNAPGTATSPSRLPAGSAWGAPGSQGSAPLAPAGQPLGPPSSAPVPEGDQVPSGIPSNCSRDVTAALSSWIQTVPDNSTLIFPMNGCYRIDGTLTISRRTGLVLAGNGTTLYGKYHTVGTAPHVRVYLSKDITFMNMTVKGANPKAGIGDEAFQAKLQWEAAWEISGSEQITLTSVQAYDVFGDFVTIEPEWVRTFHTARDITVQNSRFERNGRSGIAITGADRVTIKNNYIGQVRYALLNLEPQVATLPIDNVRFTGNRTGAARLPWMTNGGICNAGVSSIDVADNVMEAGSGMPLFWVIPPSGCALRGPFTIERNSLIAQQSPYAAFSFTKSQDATVRSNEVRFDRDPRTRVLVNLAKSTRASVIDNVAMVDPRDTLLFVQADNESDYVSSGNRRM